MNVELLVPGKLVALMMGRCSSWCSTAFYWAIDSSCRVVEASPKVKVWVKNGSNMRDLDVGQGLGSGDPYIKIYVHDEMERTLMKNTSGPSFGVPSDCTALLGGIIFALWKGPPFLRGLQRWGTAGRTK